MATPKAWMAWSTGKDSAWALHQARLSGKYTIVSLLTTITDPFARVSMHGVREEILDLQAESLGLPVHKVRIPFPCSNEIYAQKMKSAMETAKADGVKFVIFGDLFLEDVRKYREENLAAAGMKAVFPLWKIPTAQLARDIIASGVKAYITSLDPKKLDRRFAGREFTVDLIDELPAGADPCAENGEFHTVAVAGPMFKKPIPAAVGETVERDGFVFTDVLVKRK
jgi:uncharacterized protein (TIGR00290 family)